VTPVIVDPPGQIKTLDQVFESKFVDGAPMMCAGLIQYKLFQIQLDRYMEECMACPGWNDGESYDNP